MSHSIELPAMATLLASIPAMLGERPAVHRHSIHLAESFYVAANGWGSFCCDDPRCEYAGPRPISELEEWAASRGMTF